MNFSLRDALVVFEKWKADLPKEDLRLIKAGIIVDITVMGVYTRVMEEYQLNLLKLLAKHDLQSDISWQEDLKFYILCNDLFAWGCADAEYIESQDDVDLYEKSIEDCGADTVWVSYLFCARKRKMRPQGACYPEDESLWPLFDACGEEREIDIGNPYPQPKNNH